MGLDKINQGFDLMHAKASVQSSPITFPEENDNGSDFW